MFEKSIFIFRRDLRLNDNTGLLAAAKKSKIIIPCFIFDPKQISKKNKFKSNNAIKFMLESLKELDNSIKKFDSSLYFFYDSPEKIIKKIIKQLKINAIFVNRDYTPFSKKRDTKIEKICQKSGVIFESYDDELLCPPNTVLKNNKKPYTIFTPFFKKTSQIKINGPQKNYSFYFYKKNIKNSLKIKNLNKIFSEIKNKNFINLKINGGRANAIKILKNIKKYKNYEKEKDFPALQKTTKLSAHLKFGTVSIREVYNKIFQTFGKQHELIRQLYWRDFFTQIIYYFPDVLRKPFQKKYINLPWNYNKKKFSAWCDGKTGFPIVDAGMRQLNTTGFMHNRVRMITASFLVKDLHINWQLGEQYFATKLVDYDPAINNGNWQWIASTGCDSQPYFRIFNPWKQQKKFDSNVKYIKKWIPELKNILTKDLHTWDISYKKYNFINYPSPIINHEIEAKKTKFIFKNILLIFNHSHR